MIEQSYGRLSDVIGQPAHGSHIKEPQVTLKKPDFHVPVAPLGKPTRLRPLFNQ